MPHCLRHLLHLGSLVIVRLIIVTVEAQRVVPAPIVSQPTTTDLSASAHPPTDPRIRPEFRRQEYRGAASQD